MLFSGNVYASSNNFKLADRWVDTGITIKAGYVVGVLCLITGYMGAFQNPQGNNESKLSSLIVFVSGGAIISYTFKF